MLIATDRVGDIEGLTLALKNAVFNKGVEDVHTAIDELEVALMVLRAVIERRGTEPESQAAACKPAEAGAVPAVSSKDKRRKAKSTAKAKTKQRAASDNGSTSPLHGEGKGSIPLRSTSTVSVGSSSDGFLKI